MRSLEYKISVRRAASSYRPRRALPEGVSEDDRAIITAVVQARLAKNYLAAQTAGSPGGMTKWTQMRKLPIRGSPLWFSCAEEEGGQAGAA